MQTVRFSSKPYTNICFCMVHTFYGYLSIKSLCLACILLSANLRSRRAADKQSISWENKQNWAKIGITLWSGHWRISHWGLSQLWGTQPRTCPTNIYLDQKSSSFRATRPYTCVPSEIPQP